MPGTPGRHLQGEEGGMMISRRPNRCASIGHSPGPSIASDKQVIATNTLVSTGSGALFAGSELIEPASAPNAATIPAREVNNPIRSNAPLKHDAAPASISIDVCPGERWRYPS